MKKEKVEPFDALTIGLFLTFTLLGLILWTAIGVFYFKNDYITPFMKTTLPWLTCLAIIDIFVGIEAGARQSGKTIISTMRLLQLFVLLFIAFSIAKEVAKVM